MNALERLTMEADPKRSKPVDPPVASIDAFCDAVKESTPSIVRFAHARVGPTHAEDVVSETLACAWQLRHQYEHARGSVESWLLGIANKIIARQRRAEMRWLRALQSAAAGEATEAIDDLAAIEERVSAPSQVRELLAGLERLPHKQREALLMHVVSGLSYQDISRTVEAPIGTVRSRINRGREQLKRRTQL